jgi:mannose-6-phosphate isomerase-like protein (cupin superfamily)
MANETAPIAISLAQAVKTPLAAGETAATLMRHGTMRLLYYAPCSADVQTPHQQDEVYIVASGKGTFFCSDSYVSFGPGDVLFAPSGAKHHFEGLSNDFGSWVIFYGPKGGEH